MDKHIDRVFELNMRIFKLKFSMNFLMNLFSHLQIIAALLVGGWFVLTDRLAIGGVVAFISAIARLNDPWGDHVNYFRDMNSAYVKFRLVADAVHRLQTYYLGLAKAQSGDGEAALRSWLALEATAPADAPWLPALKSEIDRVAKEYKLDPAKLAPAGGGTAIP